MPVFVDQDALCKDWRPVMVSKDDKLTEGTASQIEGSNNSRVVWGCDRTKPQPAA